MLDTLTICNLALIEKSELDFHSGFNVVTGESGAGKSILMSAAALLFGGKADHAAIRTGCSAAEVSGSVSVEEALRPAIAELLAQADVPQEFPLFIRRKITSSGVRNFVNDESVGAKFLATLGAKLIDFHAATDQLDLTIPARQLEMLDRFAGLLKERETCRKWVDALHQLDIERAAIDAQSVSAVEAENLREMVERVEQINPEAGEEARLSGQYKMIANAKEVLTLCGKIRNMLNEAEDSLVDRLGEVHHNLQELARLEGEGAETEKLLACCDELQEDLGSLARRVEELADRTDLDGEALQALETRLEQLHALKRRYKASSEEELLEMTAAARRRLAAFDDADACRRDFDVKEKALRENLKKASALLSEKRKKNAVKLVAEVKKNLADIGFTHCSLSAEFTPVEPGATGADQMDLVFSANSGEAPHPLRKIASSGELSRFMLALKTVLADADEIPTVVFDEIDMNIGGETANQVGEKLRALGKKRQIFCISHLAQVAARADHHFHVVKSTEKGRTFSRVEELADPVPELARMLGGGDSALRHAADLSASIRKKQK